MKEVIVLTQLTIRLDETERDALREYAEDNATTMSQVVRKMIKDFLKNLNKEEE